MMSRTRSAPTPPPLQLIVNCTTILEREEECRTSPPSSLYSVLTDPASRPYQVINVNENFYLFTLRVLTTLKWRRKTISVVMTCLGIAVN